MPCRMHLWPIGLLACSISSVPASAQDWVHQFADEEIKERSNAQRSVAAGHDILVGGTSYANRPWEPTLTLIDTVGQVRWSVTPSITGWPTPTYFTNAFTVPHHGIDGGSYALAYALNSDTVEVWKVETTTGEVQWVIQLGDHLPFGERSILDLDEDRILVGYNGDLVDHFKYIDRATGEVVGGFDVPRYTTYHCPVAVAPGGTTLYYALGDTVIKAGVDEPLTRIWARTHIEDETEAVEHLHVDADGRVFAVASPQAGFLASGVMRLDTGNGDLLWWRTGMSSSFEDRRFEQLLEYADDLIIVWGPYQAGEGGFWLSRMTKADGDPVWEVEPPILTGGQPPCPGGAAVRAASIDEVGNLYVTGYYGSGGYGPAQWAIVKLTNAGTFLYSRIIDRYPSSCDRLSSGAGAHVIDGKPCFVGDLETTPAPDGFERAMATFVRMHPITGDTLIVRHFNGPHQFPSSATRMEPRAEGAYVLAQHGRAAGLSRFGADGELLWSLRCHRSYLLRPSALAVSPSGDAWFTALSLPIHYEPPFYGPEPDSLFIFRVSPDGQLLETGGVPITNTTDELRDLVVDAQNRAFIGIRRGSDLYLRRYQAGVFSSEQLLNAGYEQLPERRNVIIDHDGQSLRFANYRPAGLCWLAVDKLSLQATVVDTIYITLGNTRRPYSVEPVPDGRYVISCFDGLSYGRNTYIYDPAGVEIIWYGASGSGTGDGDDPQFSVLLGDDLYASASMEGGTVELMRAVRIPGVEYPDYVMAAPFTGPDGGDLVVRDMVHDPGRSEMVMACIERSGNAHDVVVVRADMQGNEVGMIQLPGGPSADNGPLDALLAEDGDVWVCGALDSPGYGRAGFILGVHGAIGTSTAWEATPAFAPSIWPQPAQGSFFVELGPDRIGAHVDILDVSGRKVRSLGSAAQDPLHIQRGDLPAGIYLLQVQAISGEKGGATLVLD